MLWLKGSKMNSLPFPWLDPINAVQNEPEEGDGDISNDWQTLRKEAFLIYA